MQNELLAEIKAYLANPLNPELPPFDREILQKMSSWLMAYAPGRYRMFARQLEQAPMPFRVASANGFLTDIARRLSEYGTVQQLEEKIETVVEKGFKAVEQTDALVRRVSNEKPDVSPNTKRVGKRADHEQLPEEIQARYEENLPILQQIRSKHEKLKLFYRQLKDQRSSHAAACDIEETVHAMQQCAQDVVKLNDRRLENWKVYDEAPNQSSTINHQSSPLTPHPSPLTPNQSIDADSLRKLVSTNVSYISRYTGRLLDLSEEADERVKFVNLRNEMQSRVNALLEAGWTWPENSKHRPILEKCGVKC